MTEEDIVGGVRGRGSRRGRLWLVIVPVLVAVPVLASDSGSVGDGNQIGELPASPAAQLSDSRSGGTIPAAGMMPVFAPDTDPDYAQEVMAAVLGVQSEAQFIIHWAPAFTALDNGGGLQGDSLELTWSVIPDGTIMPAQLAGEPTCASDLIATFNAVYGAGVWQAEMQSVWNDWTGQTGNVYTPAVALDPNGTPIDDGAGWPGSLGVDGVRGDLRIGGCTIDGNSGVIAYNFFPNNGDMKIESTDTFFSGNPIAPHFHNVFSHEHGHGVGLLHVCPIDFTKLMEPLINLGFTGLQHDDIRGVQRGYGDRFEVINSPNDNQGAATVLVPLGGQTENLLSLDGTADTDWFQFPVNAGDTLDVTVTPNGLTYLEGDDPAGDLCASAAPLNVNSLALVDLAFEIRDGGGVLATVNATGAGAAEGIVGFGVVTTETHYVRVFGIGTDDTQLYDLFVNRIGGAPPPVDLGDAPDPTYPTLLASTGPSHVVGGLFMGAAVDAEADGQPDPMATGDDLAGVLDDEDGVAFTSAITAGATATADVTSSGAGLLNAWADFNADGDWNDPGEQIFADVALAAGLNSLIFPVLATATDGPTFIRFRLDSGGGLTPTGPAADGEIEDYRVVIIGNEAPVALDDAATVAEGTSGGLAAPGVLDNDTDPDGDPLTAIKVTDPANGTLTLNANGSFTYVHDGSETTNDAFTYKANDGFVDSNVAAVTITVTPVNDPPLAAAVTASGDEDTTIGWTPSVSDVDGDPVSCSIATPAANGAAAVASNCSSGTYTPNPDFNGADSFTYQVSDGLATDDATVSVTIDPVEDLPPGGTFIDDDGNIHEGFIEAIAVGDITRGCNPPANDRYCPRDRVTRGQIAAFLRRALDLPPGPDRFTDDEGNIFEGDINAIAAAGITKGCNPPDNDQFCPTDFVTRGQMAAFLTRGFGYTAGSGSDKFKDDDTSIFEKDIDRLANAGVTKGCAVDRFCPDDPVRRDQMASFLGRALVLTPMVPPPRITTTTTPDELRKGSYAS